MLDMHAEVAKGLDGSSGELVMAWDGVGDPLPEDRH
jgi:hypothetical protein